MKTTEELISDLYADRCNVMDSLSKERQKYIVEFIADAVRKETAAEIADLRGKIEALVSPEVYPESLGTVYFMTKFGLAVYPLQSEIRIIPKGYALKCPPNGPVTMEKVV